MSTLSPSNNARKAPLPYVPGSRFDIRPHNPPPPFDGGQWYVKPRADEWNWNPWPRGDGAPGTATEMCLYHPPRQTPTPQDRAVRSLEIVSQIRCGDGANAQLVECRLGSRDDILVAKIFDPLYIELDCDDDHSPTYYAEWFYSCEAAAYTRIEQQGLGGKFTPRFEGCWNFEIPVCLDEKDCTTSREVRLILMEFIPGHTMEVLIQSMEYGQPPAIHPKIRMGVVATLMENSSQLDFIGVRHEDPYPRNVIIGEVVDEECRVTLIDFSHSRVRDLKCSKWLTRTGQKSDLPISPISLFNGHWPVCEIQDTWIDERYRELDMRLCWMEERWGKSSVNSGRYMPVKDNEIDRY